MKLKPSLNATGNARALLPTLAEKYFSAGREATDGNRSPKQLHQFRIATKRFRYTLELFRPVYGASLDRQTRALHELQGTLGKLSDCRSIQEMLAGDKALDAKLKQASRRHLKEFHERWGAFDAAGQLKRWKTYLGGAVGVKSK